jgi:hypothetical protein
MITSDNGNAGLPLCPNKYRILRGFPVSNMLDIALNLSSQPRVCADFRQCRLRRDGADS